MDCELSLCAQCSCLHFHCFFILFCSTFVLSATLYTSCAVRNWHYGSQRIHIENLYERKRFFMHPRHIQNNKLYKRDEHRNGKSKEYISCNNITRHHQRLHAINEQSQRVICRCAVLAGHHFYVNMSKTIIFLCIHCYSVELFTNRTCSCSFVFVRFLSRTRTNTNNFFSIQTSRTKHEQTSNI